MNSKDQKIQTAPFVDLVAVPTSLAKNPLFDIIIEEQITLQTYCSALINKILELSQSKYIPFIDYQCKLATDPLLWLNIFEKLLANNEKVFIRKHILCHYTKLFNLIEQKRKELQSSSVKEVKIKTPKRLINADTEDRHFSFHEVKIKIIRKKQAD